LNVVTKQTVPNRQEGKTMKKKLISTRLALCAASSIFFSNMAFADDIQVVITNLTAGQPFSPPVVFVHNTTFNVAGLPSDSAIEAMAEDGDNGPLLALLSGISAVGGTAAASAPLPPGGSVTLNITADSSFKYVSAAGMLVNSNDAFFLLLNGKIPDSGDVTAYADAWDAGTEENNESCTEVPGPACGGLGKESTDEGGVIHISNGIHGNGDLSGSAHDWRNPVALVVIRKKQ
jgi:hypothetical protein